MFVCSKSIWECWFLRRGENRRTWRKTSRSKGENQQQTEPNIWRWRQNLNPRVTLVGGECSHHCTTLALIETWTCAQVDFVKRWPNQKGPWWKPWRNRKDYCYQRWLLSVQTSETTGKQRKAIEWASIKKATRQRLSYFASKDWFVYNAKFSILFQAVRVRPARASKSRR